MLKSGGSHWPNGGFWRCVFRHDLTRFDMIPRWSQNDSWMIPQWPQPSDEPQMIFTWPSDDPRMTLGWAPMNLGWLSDDSKMPLRCTQMSIKWYSDDYVMTPRWPENDTPMASILWYECVIMIPTCSDRGQLYFCFFRGTEDLGRCNDFMWFYMIWDVNNPEKP